MFGKSFLVAVIVKFLANQSIEWLEKYKDETHWVEVDAWLRDKLPDWAEADVIPVVRQMIPLIITIVKKLRDDMAWNVVTLMKKEPALLG